MKNPPLPSGADRLYPNQTVQQSTLAKSSTSKHRAISLVFCGAVALLSHFDTGLQYWIERHKTPQMLACFNAVTFFGRLHFVLWLCAGLYAVAWVTKRPRPKQVASRIILSVALSGLLVSIAKPIIGRKEYFTAQRDDSHKNWLDRRWGRFPSGDSAMAWSTSTAVALEFPDLAIPSYALATLTAVGRVYRSAHLLSDVVAGAGLGFACAWWLKRSLAQKSPIL